MPQTEIVTCERCGEPSTLYRGNRRFCPRHHRFLQMQGKAHDRKLTIPSYEELEAMFEATGMECPVCHRRMNWFLKDGIQTVMTLQHDRSGAMRLLCLSCNVRHRDYEGDSFYKVGPDQKRCSICEVVKTLADFGTYNRGTWANKRTVCRACFAEDRTKNRAERNAYNREYYTKNSTAIIAQHRDYRAKKKANRREAEVVQSENTGGN